jgi:hypothetical protein
LFYKNRGLYKFQKFDIYFMSKKSVIQSDLVSVLETILPALLLFRYKQNSSKMYSSSNQIKNKQNKSTKGVKFLKQRRHAEQRVQLIQLLAPPTSHFDDLRVKPIHELNKLSDELLVKEALRLVTNDDPHGYTSTENFSIPQLLTFFATSAKSRDQGTLTKLMKAHEPSLNDITNDDSGDDICSIYIIDYFSFFNILLLCLKVVFLCYF